MFAGIFQKIIGTKKVCLHNINRNSIERPWVCGTGRMNNEIEIYICGKRFRYILYYKMHILSKDIPEPGFAPIFAAAQ
jgi:hypothetical protein